MFMVSNPSQHSLESTELVPPESILLLLSICTVKIVLFRQESDSVEFYSVLRLLGHKGWQKENKQSNCASKNKCRKMQLTGIKFHI
jgi:hypothetical protein